MNFPSERLASLNLVPIYTRSPSETLVEAVMLSLRLRILRSCLKASISSEY